MLNKCTILIIDNEENKMLKICPTSLGIGAPAFTINKYIVEQTKYIVEQTLDMEYELGKGTEYINDVAGYFAKMFMRVKEGVKAQDKCKYTEGSLIGIDDGLYKPDCLKKHEWDDFFNWKQIRHFKFCPYCGRKIEVVEE